jgi:hypothetical protein
MALRFSLEISILNRVLGVESCRGGGEVKGEVCVCCWRKRVFAFAE